MCKVILYLLGPLDIEKSTADVGQKIDLIFLDFFRLISFFDLETHIAADPSDLLVLFHISIHAQEGLFFWPEPHIEKNCVFGPEFLAEAVEEPVVGRKFAAIFVLDAKEEVHEGREFILL